MTATAAMTDAMWEQYARDGYFVTDVIYDDDTLKTLRERFDELWQRQIEDAKRNGDPQRIKLITQRPFISGIAQQHDECMQTLRHPMLIDIARRIIGDEVDQTYDQAVLKAPTGGEAEQVNHFGWHQDAYYPLNGGNPKNWNAEKLLDLRNGFMGWLAVTRATVDNGCLWTVPGMHTQGLLPHVRDEKQRDWNAQFDKTNQQPLELQPGQLLIFTPLTPHASGPNVTTDEVRMAYQFGFATPGTCRLETVVPVLRNGVLQ